MDESTGDNKKIYIIIILVLLAAGLFVILIKSNPSFFKNVPVIGELAQKVTTNTSPTSAKKEDPGSSFSVGTNKGTNSVVPFSGSTLSPKGAYNDGSYTGFATTSTGVLILKVTISKGTMNDISFLTIPKDASQDVLHQLAASAIQQQVVEVSTISGYDDISRAFNLALSNAVSKAFKV